MLRTPALRTPTNMLVVALCASDFCMILNQAPPLFLSMLFSKYWAFGERACSWYAFLGGTFGEN